MKETGHMELRRVARTLDEACKLVEASFEYILNINGERTFPKTKITAINGKKCTSNFLN